MTNIRVITYNLLSDSLCDPEWFPKCDSAALSPETRWLRIQTKLWREIQNKSIFCLQEVSQNWAEKLQVMFERANYTMVSRLTGQEFSGYMGVVIAFPRDEFALKDCRMVRVGDLIPRPAGEKKPTTVSSSSWLGDWSKYLLGMVGLTYKQTKRSEDHWARARAKWNHLLMVSLIHKYSVVDSEENQFVVANYHMPCDFRRQTVMTLHAYYANSEAQKFAEGRAGLVFGGDFNFKPDSSQYQMIRTGEKVIDNTFQTNSPTAIRDWLKTCDYRALAPMTSAYTKVSNGHDPDFTNYAFNKLSSEPFIGTLDYLFVSKSIKVKSVIALPDGKPEQIYDTPLPNQQEPSDHLMLGADLMIGGSS